LPTAAQSRICSHGCEPMLREPYHTNHALQCSAGKPPEIPVTNNDLRHSYRVLLGYGTSITPAFTQDYEAVTTLWSEGGLFLRYSDFSP
ncbi:MAG: hypothetical protein LUG18_02610, partial [Candidatus Azobacteroides sp.]|nr:hypothetical protein [Candidatus Azobacteroides sp.]